MRHRWREHPPTVVLLVFSLILCGCAWRIGAGQVAVADVDENDLDDWEVVDAQEVDKQYRTGGAGVYFARLCLGLTLRSV